MLQETRSDLSQILKNEIQISGFFKTRYPRVWRAALIPVCRYREKNQLSILPYRCRGACQQHGYMLITIFEAVCELKPRKKNSYDLRRCGSTSRKLQMFRSEPVSMTIVNCWCWRIYWKIWKRWFPAVCDGNVLCTLDVPVTEKFQLQFYGVWRIRFLKKLYMPCINCGRCAEACPTNLMPVLMMKAWFYEGYWSF